MRTHSFTFHEVDGTVDVHTAAVDGSMEVKIRLWPAHIAPADREALRRIAQSLHTKAIAFLKTEVK